MMIPDTTRVFLGALAFLAVACSTPVAFFKLTAGESSLVLDATHLEHAIAGDDAVGNSYVRLTLSEKGISNLASFTESHFGKDLEIFHGAKRVSSKMLLRASSLRKSYSFQSKIKRKQISWRRVLRIASNIAPCPIDFPSHCRSSWRRSLSSTLRISRLIRGVNMA